MEIQLGQKYKVREGVSVCNYFSGGDIVTPTPAGKGADQTLIHGIRRPETVMMSHMNNKSHGLYLHPDQLEEV